MRNRKQLTVIQTLPRLDAGGVERGTLEVAAELVQRGHRSIVISEGGQLVDGLLQNGSEHICLAIGKKSPVTLLEIPVLRKILISSAANIIHARSRLPAWIAYLAWKGLHPATRPHFITSVHGRYSVNRYSRIMTAGERVIAISEYINEYIINNYPNTARDKCVVIPRGVSSEYFRYKYQPDKQWLDSWQYQYPRLRDRIIITLPGRLTRRKGQEDFLKIMAGLSTTDTRIHGLIVGGPHPGKESFYNELVSMTKQLGLEDRVTFTGHRTDMREIMSISAIVMSLSNEPEAFGRTVLEALCLGIPVIAYAHGGVVEILNSMFPDGLIQQNDINAAITRISTFLTKMPRVPENNPYTLTRMLDSTIHLYETLSASQH